MHKLLYPILAATALLGACDVKVSNPPGGTTEKETTIVTPGAPAPEKKIENNTTVVNPPAATTEKKTETNTTIVK